jgi:hypothetical protein
MTNLVFQFILIAAWGQDPSVAPIGSPGLDVGYVMEPRCLAPLVLANDEVVSTSINTPIIIGVSANDSAFLSTLNPASIANTGLLQPANGLIVINSNGTITYTPNTGFQGVDQFQYTICSNEFSNVCDIATVTVYVTDCFATSSENLMKYVLQLHKFCFTMT